MPPGQHRSPTKHHPCSFRALASGVPGHLGSHGDGDTGAECCALEHSTNGVVGLWGQVVGLTPHDHGVALPKRPSTMLRIMTMMTIGCCRPLPDAAWPSERRRKRTQLGESWKARPRPYCPRPYNSTVAISAGGLHPGIDHQRRGAMRHQPPQPGWPYHVPAPH